MPKRMVQFGELVDLNMLEIGAGRPRSAGSDLPVLRVADVLDGRIHRAGQISESETHSKQLGPKTSRPGDIILTTKGSVGRVAVMPSGGLTFAYSPQLCYFRPVENGPLDSRYLYYWLRSAEFWAQADAVKAQTDMADFISLQDIYSLRLQIPLVGEQRGIAEVLGALDDKIAANSTLAATVDDLLAATFAAATVTAMTGTLRELADVNVSSTKPEVSGSIHYLDIASVGVGSYQLSAPIAWAAAPGRARRVLQHGDTVWSTVRPNRRSHALVLDEIDNLIGSTGLAVLTPKRDRFAYVYEATRTDAFTAYLEGVAEGSAYPAVRGDRFLAAPVPIVSDEAIERFEAVAAPTRLRSHAATVESRTLADIRDSLLPQLMSGKIRVKDAERFVEGVV